MYISIVLWLHLFMNPKLDSITKPSAEILQHIHVRSHLLTKDQYSLEIKKLECGWYNHDILTNVQGEIFIICYYVVHIRVFQKAKLTLSALTFSSGNIYSGLCLYIPASVGPSKLTFRLAINILDVGIILAWTHFSWSQGLERKDLLVS